MASRNASVQLDTALSGFPFLELPIEIIDRIIRYKISETKSYNDGKTPIPNHTLQLNHIRVGDSFSDLVAFSSTCTYLRQLLGPRLFPSLSLIRLNQIDVILASPKSSEEYSDKRAYHRHFVKEVLETNIGSCSKSELAKTSFKAGVSGDKSFKSKYQKSLGFNNFVTYLECDNVSLKGDQLGFFPNLKELKVLDVGIPDSIHVGSIDKLRSLRFLSINANTLVRTTGWNSVLSQLKRLDLLFDFDELDPLYGLESIESALSHHPALEELNLFIDRTPAATYTDFVNLLSGISSTCQQLKSLYIRVVRTRYQRRTKKQAWKIHHEKSLGEIYIGILGNLPHLSNIGFDISVIRTFTLPVDAYPEPRVYCPGLCLTVIDKASASTRLEDSPFSGIFKLVRSIKVAEIRFQYGEVIDNSHIQALALLTNLVLLVSSSEFHPYYSGITRASLEKCWAVTDDIFVRGYYMDDIDKLPESSPQLKKKNALATVWGKTKFNSPRYKMRESFEVSHKSEAQFSHPYFRAADDDADSYSSSTAFWSVETSLAELEQYAITPREGVTRKHDDF